MNNSRLFSIIFSAALLILCSGCATPVERVPERAMTVTTGPERVFDRPVSEILPQLADALPTGVNGRVGNELVFWGYRLRGDGDVNFFACAQLEDVNCESRLTAICPAGGQELTRATEQGLVRRLNCRVVGTAGIGDLLPNCSDTENDSDLLVGLMQCR